MKIFLKETVISIVISIILIFLLSIIISKTTVRETVIIPGIVSISTISILIRRNKSVKI